MLTERFMEAEPRTARFPFKLIPNQNFDFTPFVLTDTHQVIISSLAEGTLNFQALSERAGITTSSTASSLNVLRTRLGIESKKTSAAIFHNLVTRGAITQLPTGVMPAYHQITGPQRISIDQDSLQQLIGKWQLSGCQVSIIKAVAQGKMQYLEVASAYDYSERTVRSAANRLAEKLYPEEQSLFVLQLLHRMLLEGVYRQVPLEEGA